MCYSAGMQQMGLSWPEIQPPLAPGVTVRETWLSPEAYPQTALHELTHKLALLPGHSPSLHCPETPCPLSPVSYVILQQQAFRTCIQTPVNTLSHSKNKLQKMK